MQLQATESNWFPTFRHNPDDDHHYNQSNPDCSAKPRT